MVIFQIKCHWKNNPVIKYLPFYDEYFDNFDTSGVKSHDSRIFYVSENIIAFQWKPKPFRHVADEILS